MSANTHHTKQKGDTAVALVIFDLTKKGYFVSQPLSENAPYDLICDTGEEIFKIQVKCRKDGSLPSTTSWNDSSGNHKNAIKDNAFDYFALVNEDFSKVCYPSITLKGKKISWKELLIFRDYYYWEDFTEFKNKVDKRSTEKDFVVSNRKAGLRKKKITWPSKENLTKMVWEKPTSSIAKELGVTDSAIGKKCKALGIPKPPRGYWAKKANDK